MWYIRFLTFAKEAFITHWRMWQFKKKKKHGENKIYLSPLFGGVKNKIPDDTFKEIL